MRTNRILCSDAFNTFNSNIFFTSSAHRTSHRHRHGSLSFTFHAQAQTHSQLTHSVRFVSFISLLTLSLSGVETDSISISYPILFRAAVAEEPWSGNAHVSISFHIRKKIIMFLSTRRLEPFRSHIYIFYRLQLYATVFGLRKRHKTRLQQRKDKRFKLNTFQTTFTWIETKKKESTKNRIRKYIWLKDDTGKKMHRPKNERLNKY